MRPRRGGRRPSRLAAAPGLSAEVRAGAGVVSVRVERSVGLTFLGVLGLGPLAVSATAEAEPRAGVGGSP